MLTTKKSKDVIFLFLFFFGVFFPSVNWMFCSLVLSTDESLLESLKHSRIMWHNYFLN